MKKNKLGSGIGYGHRKMAIEQLEGRSMLAGNVSVSVDAAGNLFVRGDNNDNAVLIQQEGPGTYTVTGFDFADGNLSGFQSGPTTIHGGQDVGGGTHVFTGVKGDINIDLKKGNDALAIGNSIDDLVALAQDCGFGLGLGSSSGTISNSAAATQQVSAGKFFAPQNLIINMGDGNNAVGVIADVKYSEVILGGKNADGVAVGNGSASLSSSNISDAEIGASLVISTGKGDDNICVDHASIRGALVVNAGDGFNRVDGNQFEALSAAVVTGNQNDNVSLTNFDLDTSLTINTGNAARGGGDQVSANQFTAGQGFGPNALPHGGGAVTVVTGNGNDLASLSNFTADVVVLNTGTGNDGSTARDTAAIASQLISLLGPITVHDATITTSLVVALGAGNDFADVDNVKAHDIVLDAGAGNDGNDPDGDFPIEVDNCTVAGSVTVLGGAGNDRLEVRNEFDEVEGAHIGGNLVVDAGSGNDDVTLGGSSESDRGLDVHGSAVVSLGAGNDFMLATNVNVDHNATIDAGAGNDEVDIEDSLILGVTTIVMGSGNDTLSIFNSGGGNNANSMLIVNGGAGTDTFNNDLGVTANGKKGNITTVLFEFFGD